MDRRGYILIDRNIRDWKHWQAKPFSPAHAFLDLLLRAAYADHTVMFGGQEIKLLRGQLVASYRILAKEWGWSTKRVRRLVRMWTDGGSISPRSGNRSGTLITIVNYEQYQNPVNRRGHSKRNGEDTVRTQSGHSEDTGEKEGKERNTGKERKQQRAIALRILLFLNEKAGRNYPTEGKAADTSLKVIMARIKEGASEQDCKSVIARKIREWGENPKMSANLKPSTLFRPSNFWEYHGQLGTDAGLDLEHMR